MVLVVSIVILTVLAPFYLDIFQPTELCRQYLSAKMFIVLLERLVIALGGLLIVAFIHQIVMSHKFCGPLVNFVNSFKKISKGDLTRKIYLRRYDFLKDEAQQLNGMIEGLSKAIYEIKKENTLLMSTIEGATDKQPNPQEFSDILRETKKHADSCQHLLSNFNLLEELNTEENPS
jgi:methyl-accepting chemotaxis protein